MLYELYISSPYVPLPSSKHFTGNPSEELTGINSV